jgi:O-antigen/teichoic acid export membrane protein
VNAAPRSGAGQVLRNGAALLLAYAVPRVFNVASVVVAARWLGTEDFGAYGTAAAFAVIASVLATLGMLPLLVREIARAPERAGRLLRAAHVVKTGSCALMIAVAFGVGRLLFPGAAELRAAAMVLCLGWVMNAYAENLAAWFQAVERMGRWTQASAVFGVVSSVVGVTLLIRTGSLVAYCWGFVAGWGCALAWLVLGIPVDARRPVGPTGPEVRALLAGLAPFAGAFVGLTLYSKMDVLLLQRWSGGVQVGVYSAAYKFVDVFQALLVVAAGSVLPRLARTFGGRRTSTWAGGRVTEIVLLGAVPVGLSLHLAAGPVVRILFGPAYAGSVPVLTRLALLLPLLGLTIHGAYVLAAAGRMLPVAALYVVAVAVNLTLNAVLIPTSGAEGAALARLISEAVLVAGFLAALRDVGAMPRWRVVGAVTAVTAAALATRVVTDPTDGWLRAIAVLALTPPLYVAFGAVGRDDVALLRGAVGGRGAPSAGGVA